MNFGLSEEQELLARSARTLLAAECPPALVRETFRDPEGFPRQLYRRLADGGWLGLLVPERFGGAGGTMLDLAVLCEEAGRAALPGPFLSTAVLAPLAIGRAGSAAQKTAWLPRLTAGDAVGAVAILEASDRHDPAGIAARARRTADGFRLTGTKMFVPDAHVADVLVVAARLAAAPARRRGRGGTARRRAASDPAAGISLFLVERGTPGLAVRPLDTIDQTRRVFEVELRDVHLPATALLGRAGAGWPVVTRLLDAGAVALAADGLGGAGRALEMSVAYAKIREQFGRPIGSFQAVKHMAAEMVAEIEPARSLVWYAAYAFDQRPREASRAASIAKARLSEVYSRTTNRAVQIHGGIGFTWEHDLHFWFKRAAWNEATFGDPTFHRERLARIERF